MDLKKIARNKYHTERTINFEKNYNNVKDTDSGISSASSCDIQEDMDKSYVTLANKTLPSVIEECTKKVLRVHLKKSLYIENLIKLDKHKYMHNLELFEPSTVIHAPWPDSESLARGMSSLGNQPKEKRIRKIKTNRKAKITAIPININNVFSDRLEVYNVGISESDVKSNIMPKTNMHQKSNAFLPSSSNSSEVKVVQSLKITKSIYSDQQIVSFVPLSSDHFNSADDLTTQNIPQVMKREAIRSDYEHMTKANLKVKKFKILQYRKRKKLWKRDVSLDLIRVTSYDSIFKNALLVSKPNYIDYKTQAKNLCCGSIGTSVHSSDFDDNLSLHSMRSLKSPRVLNIYPKNITARESSYVNKSPCEFIESHRKSTDNEYITYNRKSPCSISKSPKQSRYGDSFVRWGSPECVKFLPTQHKSPIKIPQKDNQVTLSSPSTFSSTARVNLKHLSQDNTNEVIDREASFNVIPDNLENTVTQVGNFLDQEISQQSKIHKPYKFRNEEHYLKEETNIVSTTSVNKQKLTSSELFKKNDSYQNSDIFKIKNFTQSVSSNVDEQKKNVHTNFNKSKVEDPKDFHRTSLNVQYASLQHDEPIKPLLNMDFTNFYRTDILGNNNVSKPSNSVYLDRAECQNKPQNSFICINNNNEKVSVKNMSHINQDSKPKFNSEFSESIVTKQTVRNNILNNDFIGKYNKSPPINNLTNVDLKLKQQRISTQKSVYSNATSNNDTLKNLNRSDYINNKRLFTKSSDFTKPKNLSKKNFNICEDIPSVDNLINMEGQQSKTSNLSHNSQIPASDTQLMGPPKGDLRALLTKKRKSVFQAPMLPLSKRPPTRITPSVRCKAVKGPTLPGKQIDSDTIDLDTISLFAESVLDLSATTNSFPINNTEDIHKTDNILEQEKSDISNDTIGNNICDKNLKEVPYLNISHNEEVAETSTSKVDEWITSTSSSSFINDSDIRHQFSRFCYFYFSKGSCYHGRNCRFLHFVPNKFYNFVTKLTPAQIRGIFVDKISSTRLFCCICPILINQLKEKECSLELIEIVGDIMHVEVLNKTPYIKQIVKVLQNLGYSFVSAITEIINLHGTKAKSLFDILLLLVVEEDGCLENNWDVITELKKCQTQEFDFGVVTHILEKCINADPPNQQFCENIYKDILMSSELNINNISREVIIKFINLLYRFNLCSFAEHIRRICNFSLSDVIATPTDKPLINTETVDVTGTIESTIENEFSQDSSTSDSVNTESLTSAPGNSPEYIPDNESIYDPTNEFNINNEDNYTENLLNDSQTIEPYVPPGINMLSADEYVPTKFSSYNVDVPNLDNITKSFDEYVSHTYRIINKNSGYRTVSPEHVEHNQTSNNGFSIDNINHNTSSTPFEFTETTQFSNNFSSTSKSTTPNAEKYESVLGEADMSNNDIIKLLHSIRNNDISDILSLLQKYSKPELAKQFVVHTITSLKQLPAIESACQIITSIFSHLESLAPKNMQPNLKHTLQLLAFNVLPFLDQRKEYKIATNILNRYVHDLSNFVQTKCIYHSDYLGSEKLKYLFIFKILTRNGKYREALKIIKSPELKLFDNIFSENTAESLLRYKIRLINEFVEDTLNFNLLIAKDMIHFLILNLHNDDNLDIALYLNRLIINMLNQYNEYKIELLSLYENIINGWYKYLKAKTLRGLLIQLYDDLSDKKIIELYQICISLGIYRIFEGNQNCVTVSTNMVKEEIYLILHTYFHNICRNDYPLKNIIIAIEPTIVEDDTTLLISILTNSETTYIEMRSRILNVLNKFQYPPTSHDESEKFIILNIDDLQLTLKPYKCENPPLVKFKYR